MINICKASHFLMISCQQAFEHLFRWIMQFVRMGKKNKCTRDLWSFFDISGETVTQL